MIEAAAGMLSGLLILNGIVPEDDREIYEYGFACFIADAVQLTLLITFALLSRLIMETVCFAACFTTIKRHIGGWHANSHYLCICFTTTMTTASVLACVHTRKGLYMPMIMVLLPVAAVLVIRFAPVLHCNNPKTEKEVHKHRKASLLILSLQAALILVAATALPRNQILSLCGACGLFAATITLIIPNREGGQENE